MKFAKFLAGMVTWTIMSYVYAYYAHVAPESIYDEWVSSLEFISCLFMIAYFIGIPILTALWIRDE